MGYSNTMRFQVLDSFRGVMAIAVVFLHLNANSHFTYLDIVRNAHVAVDFFFVLSGFVIAHTYVGRLSTSIDLKRFFVKRFFRLWPLHFYILMIFVLFKILDHVAFLLGYGEAGLQLKYLFTFFINLFLLNAFQHTVDLTWNFPAWSISSELIAYFLFAIFILKVKKINLKIIIPVIFFTSIFLLPEVRSYLNLGYSSIARVIFDFSLGCVLYKILRTGSISIKVSSWNILETFSLLLLFAIFYLYDDFKYANILAPVLFSCILAVFTVESGWVSKFLKHPFFIRLGLYSYSIYMIHILVFFVAGKIVSVMEKIFSVDLRLESPIEGVSADLVDFGNVFYGDVYTLFLIVLVIVISHFTYCRIEKPWIERGKRIEQRYVS